MKVILYLCDVDKYAECPKTHCQSKGIANGCNHTLNVNYAKNYSNIPSDKELSSSFKLVKCDNDEHLLEKGGTQ